MKTNDIEILNRAIELQKREIMDYANAVIFAEDESLSGKLISVLNEKIVILGNLRKYKLTENKNRTAVPVSKEEMRAIIKEFSSD